MTGRSLDSAQQISNVLVHRLTEGRTFDPVGRTFADWVPATDDPALAAQLADIASVGDARRAQLGRELADDAPAWAKELLGDVPSDSAGRADWIERAGIIAAHRELTGHDDPADALGPAPKPGHAEAYASWRAAWRASGQPDIDRAESGMTDGQLRMRVRAWQRELPWAPRRVANELAGTIQAAEHHRQDAQLKVAEAEAAATPADRERLTREATESAALADALEAEVPTLRELDDTWAKWLAHTAGTRAAADRAHAELGNRHALETPDDERVTATEWAAAHAEAEQHEDRHREITEHDLVEDSHAEVVRAKELVQPADTIDLRELVADEERGADEDLVRVPTAEETSDSVRRAERSLTEIHYRTAADAAREAEEAERYARVEYWRSDSLSDQAERADEQVPTLEWSDHA